MKYLYNLSFAVLAIGSRVLIASEFPTRFKVICGETQAVTEVQSPRYVSYRDVLNIPPATESPFDESSSRNQLIATRLVDRVYSAPMNPKTIRLLERKYTRKALEDYRLLEVDLRHFVTELESWNELRRLEGGLESLRERGNEIQKNYGIEIPLGTRSLLNLATGLIQKRKAANKTLQTLFNESRYLHPEEGEGSTWFVSSAVPSAENTQRSCLVVYQGLINWEHSDGKEIPMDADKMNKELLRTLSYVQDFSSSNEESSDSEHREYQDIIGRIKGKIQALGTIPKM